MEIVEDGARPPALGCPGWLRGSGRAFPTRLTRGDVHLDGESLVWRSARRWQPTVALDVTMIEPIGQRPMRRLEAWRVDEPHTVFVLRYLTVGIELAVPQRDAAVVTAALDPARR